MKNRFTKRFVLVFLIILAAASTAMLFGCGQKINPPTTVIIFTDPIEKLAELNNSSFTSKLFYEAIAIESLLNKSGTQVHMGFWSGPKDTSLTSNRTYLIGLLNEINSISTSLSPIQRAIWDEGTNTSASSQYPSYIIMNNEHWYDRSKAINGVFTMEGATYVDPHPVTFAQADDIWGKYSQRYADTARNFKQSTGRTVETWCFVNGAKSNRVFYVYELPELVSLEAEGTVYVYFSKSQSANWLSPSDWFIGTSNAPTPEAP